MQSRCHFLCLVFVLLILAVTTMARNRFPVMSYADYDGTLNKSQFYAHLDSFGVSYFLTFQPDTAAYYANQLGLDSMTFLTNHWRKGGTIDYRIYLDSPNNSVDIYTGAEFSVNGRMSARNQNAVEGYRSTSQIGLADFDNDFLVPVWSALTARDDSGLIISKPNLGIFHRPNPRVSTQPVRLDARMRLLTPGLEGNTVVARLMFTRWRAAGLDSSCQPEGDTLLAVSLNDTSLIVNLAGGGKDTVRSLDTITSSDFIVLATCDRKNFDNPDTMLARQFTNICYTSDNNTICLFPYKYVREIRAADFPDTANYVTLGLDCLMSDGTIWHYYELEWTDKGSLFVDSLYITNDLGRKYDSLAMMQTQQCVQQIVNYYDQRLPGARSSQIDGFYIYDEPFGTALQQLEKTKKIISSVTGQYPKKYLTTLGGPTTYWDNSLERHQFETYVHYTQVDELILDLYLNHCTISPSSDTSYEANWQRLMDEVPGFDSTWAPQSYARNFEWRRAEAERIGDARQRPLDYWMILPSYYDFEEVNSAHYGYKYARRNRYFSGTEMRAVVNMALIYGAKGIGYWPYLGYKAQYADSEQYNATPRMKTSATAAALGMEVEVDGESSEFDAAYPYCEFSNNPQYFQSGIVNTQLDNSVVRTQAWFDYRSINLYLDSMAFFFNDATWMSAAPWTADLRLLDGSFIDSVRSTATYDSAYIHVAFFEKDGDKCAYILNRRVDSMNVDKIDSQTITIYMPGAGKYEIWGMDDDGSSDGLPENFCDTVYDSCGTVIHTQFLGPGRALLLRLRQLKKYWRGTLATNETWPSFATIRLTGDLTVPAGKTLTIQGGRPRIQSYVDSSHAGVDVNKTEINVYGVLRAEAPIGDSIVISPQTYEDTARAAWRGIRVFANGKVHLDRVRIRGAVSGLETQHTEVDTVKNSRFENCLSHGIHSIQAPLFLYADTFICHDTLALTNYGLRIDGPHGFLEIEEEMGGGGEEEEILGGGGDDGGMIINGIGPGRTVVDAGYCVFKEVKYPIYAIGARPTIDHCKFDCAKIKGGANPAAVHIDTNSVATITYSEILNYGTGIRVDKGASVTATRCSFSSTHFWSNNQGPSMYVGIDADSAAYSTCVIRSCCFFAIDYRSVVSDNNIADLGNLFDAGHNNFFIDTVTAVKAFPGKFIVNNSTDTLQAMGNYFAVSGGVEGPADTSFSYSSPDLFCEEPIGGESKLASPADESSLPRTIEVGQNYPNPFNPSTEVRFFIPEAQHVSVEVLNVIGQRVARLIDSDLAAGDHFVVWNGQDESGARVASGIYLFRFVAADHHVTKKMILLK